MRSSIRQAITLSAALLLGGCATNEEPMLGDNRAQPVCPKGTTFACTLYNGQRQKCMCAEREDLRAILNPVNDY